MLSIEFFTANIRNPHTLRIPVILNAHSVRS